ncbi:class IV adenylate cyclase [Kineosporia sp. NBRC 101731]|uniref:class IV adenylate cyclase n=1 Tax=Kineosporia sp. NBRC 101731 TaxID=3032199 RepID=UPI0024A3E972|nr:class IV adenylate cyclase [Kineosporia sp. NBRC 101731]GLY29835.1 adenylate cyclase [Kineosporia sp. NBRC 101731]
MDYIEVEKKFILPNAEKLRARLAATGAQPSDPVQQIDAYYNAPHRDFTAADTIDEWLRLRTSKRGASLNYKLWHPTGAQLKTHADEYESPVGDPEAIRRTLIALGFTPLVTVDKTRTIWELPDVEVALDQVAGAGDFVEFEYKGQADSIEKATATLDHLIGELSVELGDLVTRGYPHILLDRPY